jgi:hypothetical protein
MDAEFGVASMAPLFRNDATTKASTSKVQTLLELPRADNENIKALIEQLITWSAGTKNKQDGPMALWFAETQMRDYINQTGCIRQYIREESIRYTQSQIANRKVVNLEEYAKTPRETG